MSHCVLWAWQIWKVGLFTDMCILSGCDYLPSIPGVGLKTAHAALSMYRSLQRAASELHIKFVLSKAQAAGAAERAELLQLTSEHLELCKSCQEVFKHATVWDPATCALVPLHQLCNALDQPHQDLLGPIMAPSHAKLLCEDGVLNPLTLEAHPAAEQPACLPKKGLGRSRFFEALCPRLETTTSIPSSVSLVPDRDRTGATAETDALMAGGAAASCGSGKAAFMRSDSGHCSSLRSLTPVHSTARHVPPSNEAKTSCFPYCRSLAIDPPPNLGDNFLRRFREF